jgi:hypothetical protein
MITTLYIITLGDEAVDHWIGRGQPYRTLAAARAASQYDGSFSHYHKSVWSDRSRIAKAAGIYNTSSAQQERPVWIVEFER